MIVPMMGLMTTDAGLGPRGPILLSKTPSPVRVVCACVVCAHRVRVLWHPCACMCCTSVCVHVTWWEVRMCPLRVVGKGRLKAGASHIQGGSGL